MMELLNGALTLNQQMMLKLRESPQVVRRGMLVLLLVGLLVGAVQSISAMIAEPSPDEQISALRTQIDESLRQQALIANSDAEREAIRLLNENKEPLLNLVRSLLVLPTPLPQPVGSVLQALGFFVSTPLRYLGWLALVVALTQLAAHQLGGQGSLQQMLGLGALSVAPHALDALVIVPVIGPVFAMAAWGWGLVILVIATGVVHKFDSQRAAVAVLLYPFIGAVLGILGCCCYMLLAVFAAGIGG